MNPIRRAIPPACVAATLLTGTLALAVPPDYVLLKRCSATMDGRRPGNSASWQVGVPFVSIQLAKGIGGWPARHTFEFDTYAFCNGPNGYPEYGTGDDVCLGRAADLPGALEYSAITKGPDAASGSYSLTESPTGDYAINLNISATINGSFTTSPNANITLSYFNHHALRWTSGGDSGHVEISTNGGAIWTEVKFHMFYLGDKAQFKRTDVDLSAYDGQTLRLRFRFTSDGGSSDDGWFIDDVRLIADGTTLFFDDFESGTGNWTLAGTWGLSLPLYNFSNLGSIDANGVYSTTPVTNPVTSGEGMGFALASALYSEANIKRLAYAQIHHTAPQFKAAPERGYDDLCPAIGSCATAAVGEEGVPKRRVVLEQNRPNPFNPTTDIGFLLLEPSPVSLRIYDEAGRLVRTLLDEKMLPAGDHGFSWNGLDAGGQRLRSGIYFYELRVGGQDHTRKMVLLK